MIYLWACTCIYIYLGNIIAYSALSSRRGSQKQSGGLMCRASNLLAGMYMPFYSQGVKIHVHIYVLMTELVSRWVCKTVRRYVVVHVHYEIDTKSNIYVCALYIDDWSIHNFCTRRYALEHVCKYFHACIDYNMHQCRREQWAKICVLVQSLVMFEHSVKVARAGFGLYTLRERAALKIQGWYRKSTKRKRR